MAEVDDDARPSQRLKAQSVGRMDLPTPLRASLTASLRAAFGRQLWPFLVLAVASGVGCWFVKGRAAFTGSVHDDLRLLVGILPRILAAMALAGLVQVLVPREAVARVLGEGAGAKGIALAAAAGPVTPGGPMTSFPIVSAIHAAGAGRAALIAYLTSWSVLGFQRILAWEVPLMGVDFALIRFLSSLPLPFVAAGISSLLPRSQSDVRPREPGH